MIYLSCEKDENKQIEASLAHFLKKDEQSTRESLLTSSSKTQSCSDFPAENPALATACLMTSRVVASSGSLRMAYGVWSLMSCTTRKDILLRPSCSASGGRPSEIRLTYFIEGTQVVSQRQQYTHSERMIKISR